MTDRITELLEANKRFEQRARMAERVLKPLITLRRASEYHEDMGNVLWWRVPIAEPPYVGTPNDRGMPILVTVSPIVPSFEREGGEAIYDIGGWREGYYTHFSPLPPVELP